MVLISMYRIYRESHADIRSGIKAHLEVFGLKPFRDEIGLAVWMIMLYIQACVRHFRRAADNENIITTLEALCYNPKTFWDYIDTKKKTDGIPTVMFHGVAKVRDGSCELFVSTDRVSRFQDFGAYWFWYYLLLWG